MIVTQVATSTVSMDIGGAARDVGVRLRALLHEHGPRLRVGEEVDGRCEPYRGQPQHSRRPV